MGQPALGEFLKLKAIKKGAEALVDNSGMSGLEASNHLHRPNPKDMYFSKQKGSLIFELKRIEPLGQLHIWNYNAPRKLSSGMKEITVSYSLDGKKFRKFGDFDLAIAPNYENELYGGIAATNLNDGHRTPIDFQGIPAKFIKITPRSNHGGEGYGLSEIRLFRHKIRPNVGESIPVEAFCPKDLDSMAVRAVTGIGLSGRTSRRATTGTDPETMWHTNCSAADASIIVNFDGTYPIREMAIWNYNDPNALDDGVQELDIYYTVKSPCEIINKEEEVQDGDDKKLVVVGQEFDFVKGQWEKLGTFKIPKGTGAEKMPLSTIIPFGDIHAQHIRLQPVKNYGGRGFGLSEVRFFSGKGWAVEPARNWTGLLSTSGDFRYCGTAATREGGWIGADGIFSYNLDGPQVQGTNNKDSNNIFIFQDTVVGKFNNYKGWTPKYGFTASHNGWVNGSYLYLKGNEPDPRKARFVLQGANSEQNPYGNITDEHYWLCDYTKVGNALYIVGIRYFGWDSPEGPNGHDLVRIPLGADGYPDLDKVPELVVKDVPNYIRNKDTTLHFEAILENTEESGMPSPDGYIYIYGRQGSGRKLIISRVRKSDYADHSQYEYWNGSEWVQGDPLAANTPEAIIGDYAVGNEGSISPIRGGMFDGKFLNVYTAGSIDGQVAFTSSDSMTGPFTDPTHIYWAVERYKIPLDYYEGEPLYQWNYNAKAHHNLSKEGELLISYHMGLQHAGNLTVALEYHHPWFITMFEIK